jgi:hypothetical protein
MWTRMTPRVLTLLLASSSFAPAAFADDPANGELVVVDASYVFAPIGFDDNDEVSVVIDGYLPSGCYRLMRPEVKIDPLTRQITVVPTARYFDVPCIDALIPYWQEVRLGRLAQGDYKISVAPSGLQERLDIAEAQNAGPDDYLYAAIDTAQVDRQDGSNTSVIKIAGRFTNSCMVMDEVRVIDTGKTINVLPIMHMEDLNDCQPVETEFRRMIELPATVSEGRHLLHVRSLNGVAVNHVFTR